MSSTGDNSASAHPTVLAGLIAEQNARAEGNRFITVREHRQAMAALEERLTSRFRSLLADHGSAHNRQVG